METLATDSGLKVLDLRTDSAFAARRLHPREMETQMAGLQRISRALLQNPDAVLHELVSAAVDLCGADSAGISIIKEGGKDDNFYHWVATAGAYSGFLNAILPRYPSACGITLERGHPQHFTVQKEFFDLLGVEAPLVTDGLLFPWATDDSCGTIFVMAHGSDEAFDQNDVRLMRMLADFAAMGFRQKKQHARALAQERTSAAAKMAHQLAHEINNPLQSMTNAAFLVASGGTEAETKALGRDLLNEVQRLFVLVQKLLTIPLTPDNSQ